MMVLRADLSPAQWSRIRLVCGLGNPSDTSQAVSYTRHDMGFMVLDKLAAELCPRGFWKAQSGALVMELERPQSKTATSKSTYKAQQNEALLLVKPQSYMNTSGGPLSKIARSYGIKAAEILVIHDELDLSVGELKCKFSGGLNAHNGLRSIAQKFCTQDFARLMIGIGRPPGKMPVAQYVLKELKKEELLNSELNAAEAADLLYKKLTAAANS